MHPVTIFANFRRMNITCFHPIFARMFFISALNFSLDGTSTSRPRNQALKFLNYEDLLTFLKKLEMGEKFVVNVCKKLNFKRWMAHLWYRKSMTFSEKNCQDTHQERLHPTGNTPHHNTRHLHVCVTQNEGRTTFWEAIMLHGFMCDTKLAAKKKTKLTSMQ